MDITHFNKLIEYASYHIMEEAHKVNEPMDVEKVKEMAESIGLSSLHDEIDDVWLVRRAEIIESINENLSREL